LFVPAARRLLGDRPYFAGGCRMRGI